jgi:hypothetical protein
MPDVSFAAKALGLPPLQSQHTGWMPLYCRCTMLAAVRRQPENMVLSQKYGAFGTLILNQTKNQPRGRANVLVIHPDIMDEVKT